VLSSTFFFFLTWILQAIRQRQALLKPIAS
jgi:hypothetical protein